MTRFLLKCLNGWLDRWMESRGLSGPGPDVRPAGVLDDVHRAARDGSGLALGRQAVRELSLEVHRIAAGPHAPPQQTTPDQAGQPCLSAAAAAAASQAKSLADLADGLAGSAAELHGLCEEIKVLASGIDGAGGAG